MIILGFEKKFTDYALIRTFIYIILLNFELRTIFLQTIEFS